MVTADAARNDLHALFEATFGERVRSCEPLRADGSSRLLFRLAGDHRSVVGVRHDNREENAAFLGFSRHFRALGLPVPEIFAEDPDRGLYLETDLGNESLAVRHQRARETGSGSESVLSLYEKVVRRLPRFQVFGAGGLDRSLCYQGCEFDAEAMHRDLAYFRDSFLDLLVSGDAASDALEEDFENLARFLDAEERAFFLYRDFQSRNVMLVGEEPFFIDYQSGRMGASEYDLASILYEARAELGGPVRARLLDVYLNEAGKLVRLDEARFRRFFPAFACIRILQALGAYGNLGVRKGKTRFLRGIPAALANLGSLMSSPDFPVDLPELRRLALSLAENPGSLRAALS
jgi:aminoglycoside/choline kinase family phosphotransferase